MARRTMTVEEYRELTAAPKGKANKHRAQPTVYGGVRYASKREAEYAAMLDRAQGKGSIRFWIGQPRFRLGVAENVYVADFLVVQIDAGAYAVDVKGRDTPKFRRDRKLWERFGPCRLHIEYRDRCVIIEGDQSQ